MIDTIKQLLGRMQWPIVVGDEQATGAYIRLYVHSETVVSITLHGMTYDVTAYSITLVKHILAEQESFKCERMCGNNNVSLHVTLLAKSRMLGMSETHSYP